MNAGVLRPYFLITLIAVSSVLAFFVFRPFLTTLALAGIFAMLLQPLYRFILRGMSGSPGLAAFATMLLAVICILVPLMFISLQLADDAQHLYASLTNGTGR